MQVAYLINQYPKISHSFIRREIQAIERLGVSVMRISIRGWNEPLADTEDALERGKTRYVLQRGPLLLIVAFFHLLLINPIKTLRALLLELKMSRRSARPLPVHLVYLAEACQTFLWLKQANINHLHAHFGTNSAEVAMLVRMLGGPPWSFTVHGPEEFDKQFEIGLAEKIRRANFVVAISSYGRSQLYRLANHRLWAKIHVVHCGLDRNFVDNAPIQSPSQRRLVCVGRICEQKGQLLLLEAAKLLADKGIDFELVLAGDGEMRADAEQFISDHNLKSKVTVTGWVSNAEVRSQILKARALVMPSFAEGLPVAIMEAMALARPVISTYVAGIPELVRPEEHGWLTPAGDAISLADTIEKCLATDNRQLDLIGQAAKLRVQQRHDVDREASRLHQLFLQTQSQAN